MFRTPFAPDSPYLNEATTTTLAEHIVGGPGDTGNPIHTITSFDYRPTTDPVVDVDRLNTTTTTPTSPGSSSASCSPPPGGPPTKCGRCWRVRCRSARSTAATTRSGTEHNPAHHHRPVVEPKN